MKRKLLLAAAAATCLAWCSAASALPAGPQRDNGKPDQSQTQDQGKGQGKGQGHDAGAAGKAAGKGAGGAPGGGAPGGAGAAGGAVVHGANLGGQNVVTVHQGANGGTGQGQGGQQNRRRGPVLTAPTNIPAVVGHPSGAGSVTLQGGNHVTSRRTTVTGHPPANLPALSGWSHGITGQARDQQDQQWRQSHGGWDHSAPWRTNQNWWRGNLAFRLFSGERLGFFFIPGLGYVSAPSEYRVHYWRAGDMLPAWFWRYPVRDYWNYGLPQPPDGCTWVWVDNDVALIDASDGYVLDIVHNAW